MKVLTDISLKPYNTFKTDAIASTFIIIEHEDETRKLNHYTTRDKYLILSGGSNTLFKGNFKGVILHPVFKGIGIVGEKDNNVLVKVSSGEIWDSFVGYCVENNFGGVENLSLIPGYCGAAPVQNIGAFGVEVKDILEEICAVNIETGEVITLRNEDCNFGYRTSIFKNQLKNSWMIVSATYRLTIKNHLCKTTYAGLQNELQDKDTLSPAGIRNAVINIRQKKLPSTEVYGNAGSFFKNPVITTEQATILKKEYEDIPLFPVDDYNVKTAAGWLIEKCGWKGKKYKTAGVYEKQALVLINYSGNTSDDVLELALKIEESVSKSFGIQLEREVIVI